jgi:hypothetical protein
MDVENNEPHPGGRPTAYRPEFVTQAEKLCKLGATLFDIAQFFEVSTRTISRWMNEHEEFCLAVKTGGAPADERVIASLFHRATGYSFESEKVFNFQGQVVRAAVTEHVPPDPTAAIFWLKNRRPAEWRDRKELTGENGKDLIPEKRDDLELARFFAGILTNAAEKQESQE